MKVLISILIGLLVGGCATLTPEQKQQKALRDSVLGEYEHKDEDGDTLKYVFLGNGVYEWHENGEKLSAHKWSVVKDEIHIAVSNAHTDVYRINPDKSITEIASINLDGKRTDRLKDHQYTFIKIK